MTEQPTTPRQPAEPCPECRAGNHLGCDGQAWYFADNNPEPCQCADEGHVTE